MVLRTQLRRRPCMGCRAIVYGDERLIALSYREAVACRTIHTSLLTQRPYRVLAPQAGTMPPGYTI